MGQQSPRNKSLPDTLDAASRREFIGRSAELAAFDALLERPERVSVLWLSGLGGVGKTALMLAYVRRARQAGWANSSHRWAYRAVSAGLSQRSRVCRTYGQGTL
jgi:hypothetical protein